MSTLSASGKHPAITGVSALLKAVIAAVKLVAAEEIMPRYLKVAYQHKDDGSLCTEADIEAQAALIKKLQAILNVPVLGEEMTASEQQKMWEEGKEGLWCVDPIDGTSNFARGLPYFAVSVALLHDRKSVLGVVYDPVANEMFAAERGRGVFLNGQKLSARESVGELSQALAAVDLKRLKKNLVTKLVTKTPYASQRNFGASTLDWCYAAAGRYDLYLHGGQKLWDYAAGSLILTESGGNACSIEGEDFNQCDIRVRSVIVARNEKLFDEWKAWVQAQ
ncbi:MAG: inositol monophosphatase family protein [Gallionella sp.]